MSVITSVKNKYEQIFSDLCHKIWSGDYLANQQLPSENELAEYYQVSRITSKRALQELANIGLVQRRQGRGTFVRAGLKLHQRTGQVLLVIPFAADAGLGDYITGIKSILAVQHYDLVVIENRKFNFNHTELVQKQYDGVIYYPQNLAHELAALTTFSLHHIPLVLLDQHAQGLPIPAVVADNTQGGYVACNELITNHHQQIAFLAMTDFITELNSSVAQRYFGYVQALMENDSTFVTAPHDAYSLTNNNFELLIPFIKAHQITAIVTENDLLALKLLDYLQQNNLQVPEKISLIGFDNIARTAVSQPQLSTISQDFQEIGRKSAKLLLQRMSNPYNPDIKQITVPVKFTSRQSVSSLN